MTHWTCESQGVCACNEYVAQWTGLGGSKSAMYCLCGMPRLAVPTALSHYRCALEIDPICHSLSAALGSSGPMETAAMEM